MTALEEDRLSVLATQARLARPRLFAVYGLRHDSAGPPVLGWGMEFEWRADALFYVPEASVTHHTISAERVADRYSCFGDMHVEWFDSPD
jgi:hypothetical protein